MNRVFESHLKSGNFHHGYFLSGDSDVSREMALEAARIILGYEKAKLGTHPDFYHEKFDLFGIKESQELKRKTATRPFSGDKKVFIVELFSLTIESSNALLKVFEEPPEGTHFFIIIPSAEAIIPTLRSRFIVIEIAKEGVSGKIEEEFYRDFLKLSPAKRLLVVKKIDKDKQKAIELLDGLEKVLSEGIGNLLSFRTDPPATLSLARRAGTKGNSSESKIFDSFGLEQIQKARGFLSDRSPNVKMILEHIALILPKM